MHGTCVSVVTVNALYLCVCDNGKCIVLDLCVQSDAHTPDDERSFHHSQSYPGNMRDQSVSSAHSVGTCNPLLILITSVEFYSVCFFTLCSTYSCEKFTKYVYYMVHW